MSLSESAASIADFANDATAATLITENAALMLV
jgi:hypothetical protein